MKASEVHAKLGEDLDRLSKLVSAASCFKKVDPESPSIIIIYVFNSSHLIV